MTVDAANAGAASASVVNANPIFKNCIELLLTATPRPRLAGCFGIVIGRARLSSKRYLTGC
ncbi:MAG: hypothetical protein E5W55_29245 [Mesorhizobium sp.]|nr:MAG: hypothetical protein E5W55_29245 [Mesorhizobium sp.]